MKRKLLNKPSTSTVCGCSYDPNRNRVIWNPVSSCFGEGFLHYKQPLCHSGVYRIGKAGTGCRPGTEVLRKQECKEVLALVRSKPSANIHSKAISSGRLISYGCGWFFGSDVPHPDVRTEYV